MFGRPHTHTYMHSRFSLKPINQLRVFLFILFWSFLGWFFLFAVTVMVCGAFIRTLEVFCFLFFRHNLLFNFCLSPSPSLSVCECVWVVHSHPTWWYLTFIIYLFDVSPFPFFYSCFTFMFLAFFISFPFPYSTTWNLRHQDVPPVSLFLFLLLLLYKWTAVPLFMMQSAISDAMRLLCCHCCFFLSSQQITT